MGRSRSIDSLTEKANAAFRQAAAKVIERAKQTGTPVIIWEDGQVKKTPPQQVEQQLKAAGSESKIPELRQFGLGKGKLTIVCDEDVPADIVKTLE